MRPTPTIPRPVRVTLPNGCPDMWCQLPELLDHLAGDGWHLLWQESPRLLRRDGQEWLERAYRAETIAGAMAMPSVTFRALSAAIRMHVQRPRNAPAHALFARFGWESEHQHWRLYAPQVWMPPMDDPGGHP